MYKSDKQRKFLHAVHPEIAKKWDAEEAAAKGNGKKKHTKTASYQLGAQMAKTAFGWRDVGDLAWEGAKFIPGIGAIPSFLDAGASALKGNWGRAATEAGLGALSFVPGVGQAARGTKLLAQGAKVAPKLLTAGRAGLGAAERGAINTTARALPGAGH